jgi:hypothetical protein
MAKYRSVWHKDTLRKYRQALEREEKDEKFRKKQKKIKTSEIYQTISLGDKLVGKNRLKDAFYRYLSARNVATNYNKDLISYCDKKIKLLHNIVNQILNNRLEIIIQKIERLFLAERFAEIEPVARKFFNDLKEFEWVQIGDIFEEFQSIMLDYWEMIFPKLVTLADGYYDKNQHKQAIVMFAICKDVVKKFKFGPNRTHLIEAFMRYEMICTVQITISEMYRLVESARDLLDSNKIQDAMAPLNEANNLESEISTQFRDKKRLKNLHSKMNQLREASYK